MTSTAKLTGVVGRTGGVTKAYDDSGAIASRKGTRAWANNNPGNIEYGPTAKAMGAVGSDGRFAVFATPEDGFNAAKALFSGTTPRPTANALYQNGTIAENVAHWAPSFENDVGAYTKALSVAGVSPNTRVQDMTPAQLSAVIGAMSVHEGYTPGTETAASAYATPPGSTSLNAMEGWKGKPGELGTPVDQQAPTQPPVQNPHPDTSVNPYGGLLGGLGAGVTAAIQAANGIGTIAKSIGGLFSPGQQPSVSLPNHPQTPTPLGGIGPVGPVSYGGSLGATGVNAPHTPTPSTAYGGSGYQSTAGSNNPYQGSSRPYESGYESTWGQLAPGAPGVANMGPYAQAAFDDGLNSVPASPGFTTTRSLNPNYEAEKQAYATWQNANVPSMVDSFAADPSLSMVTPGTFESAFPSAPKPATPAPPKPQQYVTKQVQNKPFSPSFAAGTPVMDAIGNIVGAMGLNGKAFTPSFAAGAPITDQNGNVVGSMTGQGMQTQKPSLFGGLMSALGIGGGMSQGMGSNGAGLVGGVAPGGLNAYGNMKAGGWGNSGNGSMGGGYKTSNDGGNLHG